MKSSLSWQVYEFLTIASQSHRQTSRKSGLQQKLSGFWQSVKAYLQVSSEPYTWKTVDETGRFQWNAHDPMTNQSIHSVSEEELRVWLEERHYQYHIA